MPTLNAGKQADKLGFVSYTDVAVPLPVMFCMLPFMHLNAAFMLLLTLKRRPLLSLGPQAASAEAHNCSYNSPLVP